MIMTPKCLKIDLITKIVRRGFKSDYHINFFVRIGTTTDIPI